MENDNVMVRVNLHPDYDYSQAIIARGFIPDLMEIIHDNDYFYNNQCRGIIINTGDIGSKMTVAEYPERVAAFISAMVECGYDVKIRNERKDKFVPVPEFTTIDELIQILHAFMQTH